MMTEKTGNILVVDDEEGMRFTLNHYLVKAGYQVRQSPDIAQAVMIVADEWFDVAIIDRVLSNGRNGLHLLRILYELQPSCKTILISAWPTVESAVQAMKYQVFGYLTKPVNKDELLTMVEQAIAENRLQQKKAILK
jgi:DNA-binding NtrC family response regulator